MAAPKSEPSRRCGPKRDRSQHMFSFDLKPKKKKKKEETSQNYL